MRAIHDLKLSRKVIFANFVNVISYFDAMDFKTVSIENSFSIDKLKKLHYL